jgi:hypothetical protein
MDLAQDISAMDALTKKTFEELRQIFLEQTQGRAIKIAPELSVTYRLLYLAQRYINLTTLQTQVSSDDILDRVATILLLDSTLEHTPKIEELMKTIDFIISSLDEFKPIDLSTVLSITEKLDYPATHRLGNIYRLEYVLATNGKQAAIGKDPRIGSVYNVLEDAMDTFVMSSPRFAQEHKEQHLTILAIEAIRLMAKVSRPVNVAVCPTQAAIGFFNREEHLILPTNFHLIEKIDGQKIAIKSSAKLTANKKLSN